MVALADPIRRLRTEMSWLREEFHSAAGAPRTRREQLAAEMAVIRIYDAWARYCRELVILSASGNSLTLGGTIVPAVVRRRSDVLPTLFGTYRKRRQYEPQWASATECIDAASRLKIRNFVTLAAAMGATNSPADEIRNVRNYYAHRRRGAAQRAMACNGFMGTRPVVFDLAAYRNAGETILDSWIKGLVLVATSASQ